MINFSLNTCWRLIPTEGDNRRYSVVAFSMPTTNLVVNLRDLFEDCSIPSPFLLAPCLGLAPALLHSYHTLAPKYLHFSPYLT